MQLSSYDIENFNPQHPIYTSSYNVSIQCLDPGLLHKKVGEGELAIIPGNYALAAWGSEKTNQYKFIGKTAEIAGKSANVIATRTKDINTDKININ